MLVGARRVTDGDDDDVLATAFAAYVAAATTGCGASSSTPTASRGPGAHPGARCPAAPATSPPPHPDRIARQRFDGSPSAGRPIPPPATEMATRTPRQKRTEVGGFDPSRVRTRPRCAGDAIVDEALTLCRGAWAR